MRRLLLLAAVVLIAPTATAQAPLFAPADGARPAAPPHLAPVLGDPAVAEVDLVTADVSALTEGAVRLRLSGVERVYERTHEFRRAADDWTWIGRRGPDTAVLVARGGRVTGTVWAGPETYEVRPVGGALHAVARLAPDARRATEPDYVLASDLPPVPQRPAAAPAARVPGATATIDLVAGYTDDLSSRELDPVAAIQVGVDLTNATFLNSGIDAELVLRYAFPIASAGPRNRDRQLDFLRNPSDGAYDEVQAVRDAYGADIVALYNLDQSSGACGIAPVDAYEGDAYTVVMADCARTLTLAHEIGHLVGSLHDPYVNTGYQPYPYGQGFVDTAGRWRTVMAYNQECADGGFDCTAIPYWSSPAVTYDDTTAPEHDGPTGTAADHDNVRLWGERLAAVADFRSPPAAAAVAAVSPSALAVDVAVGATATRTLTIANAAGAGAYPLNWRTQPGRNLTANGAALGAPCEADTAIDQADASALTLLAPAYGVVRGQSFEAPCYGEVRSVAVWHQLDPGQPGLAPGADWTASVRVFDGAGGAGAELAAITETKRNPSSGGVHLATFALPAGGTVAEGAPYTWFLDVTAGEALVQHSTADPYAGGQAYAGASPAAATAQAGEDMTGTVVVGPTPAWYAFGRREGNVEPGASLTTDVTFDAAGLAAGTYTVDLVLATNDPAAPTVAVPVTFNVGGATAAETPAASDPTRLGAPFPNPSRGAATVPFHLAEAGPARLSVVDLLGREVAVLAAGDHPAGPGRVALPATLVPGVYVVRLEAGETVRTRRAVVVR